MGNVDSVEQSLNEAIRRDDGDAILKMARAGHLDDKVGVPSLFRAIKSRRGGAVSGLVRAGVSPNAALPPFLDTPLHEAARRDFPEIVQVLLSLGADPFLHNANSHSPLDVARAYRSHNAMGALVPVVASFAEFVGIVHNPFFILEVQQRRFAIVVKRRAANPKFSKLARCGHCSSVIAVGDLAVLQSNLYSLVPASCSTCSGNVLLEPRFILRPELQLLSHPHQRHTRHVLFVDECRVSHLHKEQGGDLHNSLDVRFAHHSGQFKPLLIRCSTEEDKLRLLRAVGAVRADAARPRHPADLGTLPAPPAAPPSGGPYSGAVLPPRRHQPPQPPLQQRPPPQPALQGPPATAPPASAPPSGAVPPPPPVHRPRPSVSLPPPSSAAEAGGDGGDAGDDDGSEVYGPASRAHNPSPAAAPGDAGAAGTVDTPVDAASECVVCMDATRNAVAVPCGHLCACFECLQGIKEAGQGCPVCRTQIQQAVRVYSS